LKEAFETGRETREAVEQMGWREEVDEESGKEETDDSLFNEDKAGL